MKSNFPKSLTDLSKDEVVLFQLSSEIDYNVQAIIAKLKYIASLSPQLHQMQEFDILIQNLICSINNYYETHIKEDTVESY